MMCGSASTTVTARPRCARPSAVMRPTGPAPAMSTPSSRSMPAAYETADISSADDRTLPPARRRGPRRRAAARDRAHPRVRGQHLRAVQRDAAQRAAHRDLLHARELPAVRDRHLAAAHRDRDPHQRARVRLAVRVVGAPPPGTRGGRARGDLRRPAPGEAARRAGRAGGGALRLLRRAAHRARGERRDVRSHEGRLRRARRRRPLLPARLLRDDRRGVEGRRRDAAGRLDAPRADGGAVRVMSVLARRIAAQGLASRDATTLDVLRSWTVQDSPPGAAATAIAARATSVTLDEALANRDAVALYNPRTATAILPSDEAAAFATALIAPGEDEEARIAVDSISDALDGRTLSRDDLHEELRNRLPKEMLPWCDG